MCMRCPPTVSSSCYHCRCSAGCEQVVHKNAHAKKINKVLKTLDVVVCNIIRSGAGIIIRAICWPVKREGVAERLDNGYRTIWWYCVTAVMPVAYDYTYEYQYKFTVSSKIITYTNRRRGFGLFYYYRGYVLLFCRRSVSGTVQWYATLYYSVIIVSGHDVILYLIRVTSLLLCSHQQKKLRTQKKFQAKKKLKE